MTNNSDDLRNESLEQTRAALARIPFNAFLKFELLARNDSEAEIEAPVQEWFRQEGGIIHGGLLTALADTASVYCLVPDLPADRTMTSIELKINFVRPGLMDGGTLRARSRVVQKGRKILLCDAEVHQDGKLLAKGLFTYLVYERSGAI